MKTERVDVSSLNPDPSNVRTHSPRNIKAIRSSLARFGQQKPIVVDSNGVVVAGNGTLEAALELGWDRINIVRTKLCGAEAIAFAIADNRTAELADWEDEALASLIDSLKDDITPDELGFTPEDMARLVNEWDMDKSMQGLDEYDPSQHEFYTIKVARVSHDDKDDIVGAMNEALAAQGGQYRAEAF